VNSLLIVAGGTALAAGTEPHAQGLLFSFLGKKQEMVRIADQELLVDRLCWSHRNTCKALLKLPQATLSAVRGELSGGRNPGAVVCLKLGGESVVGLDVRGNENSFCRFDDGSLISNGSLHAHARENDEPAGAR
jgi:putative hemolysin